MRRVLIASMLMGFASMAAADEWTSVRPISSMRFDSTPSNKTLYFETSTSWGPAGCSNAKYVFIRNNDSLKELLAIGMAAKVAEKNVSFIGSCQNSDYFQAYYIYVE